MTTLFYGHKILKHFYLKYLMLFVVFGFTLSLKAQQQDSTSQFKSDFFKMFDSSSKKMIELSNTIPFKEYNWAPSEKIRSIKESIIHVARTNYNLASKLNFPVPKDVIPDEFFKTAKTKKAVLAILTHSIHHIRKAIQNIDNQQLYSTVNFWGGQETKQRVILQVGEHMAEHLGQLIAYARMRGITPPWSK